MDHRFINSEFSGQFTSWNSVLVALANLPNVLGLKFGVLSAFTGAILHIFGSCSQKQMVWVNAKTHVAFMTNAQTFWNWTTRKFPCYAMRLSGAMISNGGSTVPRGFYCSSPKPASIGFVNFSPKPDGKWCTLVVSHAAYVSIVRGLVRLAPTLQLSVRAVSL